MKTVKLNLEDRVSWQKFQHVLTSFASDYIDLVAPEQTLCKLEQKTLLISFVLINSSINSDRTRANIFTQKLEAFLLRLPLVEVRRVEIELVDLNHDETILSAGFDLTYISASAIATNNSKPNTGSGLVLRRTFGNLVRGFKAWITSPDVQQNVQTGTKLAIRNPKTALAVAANFAKDQFITAINWVDTFPWEEWVQNRVAEQKRRHNRNLFKAVVEDILIFALLAFLVITSVDMLSAPTFNVANLPKQHYDEALDTNPSRCTWSGVNKKNYVCLTRGMSYRQVVYILGGEGVPLGFAPKFGDKAVIVSWQKGEEAMNVTFREDYLVAKAYLNLS